MFSGQVSHTETNHKELEGFDVQAIQALPESHGGMQVPKTIGVGAKRGRKGFRLKFRQTTKMLQSSGSKASHHMSSLSRPALYRSSCQSERIKWRASKQSLRLGSLYYLTLFLGSLVAFKEHTKSIRYTQ